MRFVQHLFLGTVLAANLPAAQADDFQVRVAMIEKSAATFYVAAEIDGFGPTELMVDTGSGYVTINETTLAALKQNGRARYLKQLRGVLADGSELTVPVYAVSAIAIGGDCWLRDVEAAVFPGNSRQILGLSALRKTAPFVFSVEPPELKLSRCANAPHEGSAEPAIASTRLLE